MPTRPSQVVLSAAGNSPWIPVNRMISAFGIGLGVKLSSSASLTYNVQHTFSDIYARAQDFSLTRSTTTATLRQVGHGLSVGDWVNIIGAGAPFDGEFAVASVVDADNITYTVPDSGATAGGWNAWLQKARVFNHDYLVTQISSQDGNYQFPPRAVRLNISSYTSGNATLTVIQAGK